MEQAGALALRQGAEKWIQPAKGPKRSDETDTELGNEPAGQLYDLANDLDETDNLAARQAERAKSLQARLEQIRAAGRSRP